MNLTENQSREIAQMTTLNQDLERLISPTGETLVTAVVNAKDYNIESPKPIIFVIVNESTFLYGEAYTVNSIEEGEATGLDRLEHINEAWQDEF